MESPLCSVQFHQGFGIGDSSSKDLSLSPCLLSLSLSCLSPLCPSLSLPNKINCFPTLLFSFLCRAGSELSTLPKNALWVPAKHNHLRKREKKREIVSKRDVDFCPQIWKCQTTFFLRRFFRFYPGIVCLFSFPFFGPIFLRSLSLSLSLSLSPVLSSSRSRSINQMPMTHTHTSPSNDKAVAAASIVSSGKEMQQIIAQQ